MTNPTTAAEPATEQIDRVQARYAAAADRIATEGHGTGLTGDADRASCFGAAHYPTDSTDYLPLRASLGCGNPVAVAEPHPGETVLGLGSGVGLDVLLSTRRVGPTGRAIGLDMTQEMLALARRHAAEAGATNAEFLLGHIENIPLADASTDVVISNCVITLSADKPQVFAEITRVLKPGGRIGISDVITDPSLTDTDRAARSHQVWSAEPRTFTESPFAPVR